MGLRDSVPAANAGIASTQKSSPILSSEEVTGPMESTHAGESYTSDMYTALQGLWYSCFKLCRYESIFNSFSNQGFKGK